MSKELERIKDECVKRMNSLNHLIWSKLDSQEIEDNKNLWWETYERFKAACEASNQQRGMHWTTSGDFSHVQSTPGVRF